MARKKAKKLDETIYDHRWGFKDTKFIVNKRGVAEMTGSRYELAGKEMPEFLPFAEEMLGVKIDTSTIKPERANKPIPAPIVNEAFLTALRESTKANQVSTDSLDRLIHSHGQTTADEVYKVLYGELERYADIVFYPETELDCGNVVKLASEHNVCLVPYGGGTSVSCALQLPANENRMIVLMDMRRMNQLLWVDKENNLACAQAGITGKDLEVELEKHGVTSGHEPDSMELSTLGGWVATNASGMKKNKYGNIDDIVQNFTMITPRGVIEQKSSLPRYSMGMQPQKLLFGNEGNLGVITKAIFRVHPLPEVKKYGSVVFPSFQQGTAFLYELSRAGVYPASIRLLDNVQFRFGAALKAKPKGISKAKGNLQKKYLLDLKKFDPHELCAATIVMEGSKAEVAYQEKVIYPLAKKFGGLKGGSTNGKRGYLLTYAIAYIRDFFQDFEILGETYETTVPWDRIDDVCKAVDEAAHRYHLEYGLPGKPYISPRITQLYHTGVAIYFTHGFCAKGIEHPDEVFAQIERAMREIIMANGGSISHHHGVGKLRKDFMEQTITPTSIELLQKMKEVHDPDNVFGIGNNIFGE